MKLICWLFGHRHRRGYNLCAASIGAAHIRQRLYWVAYASGSRREGLKFNDSIPSESVSARTITGDAAIDARAFMENDTRRLLPSHGVRVEVARNCLRGFGNAIVPQVAAAFIKATL